MFGWLFRLFGRRAIKRSVRSRGGRPPLLDVGLGFALMRNRRVPLSRKGLALLVGVAVTAALTALEIPLEGLIALLLNVPGIGLDFVVDGLEFLIGPALIGALLLTRIAPAEVVAAVRAERCPESRLLRS